VAAIRTRAEWQAEPPARPLTPYAVGAVRGTTIHWEGTPTPAIPTPALLRSIQTFHVEQRGWRDIAYNLAVDQAGAVWECRGLDYRNGAHPDGTGANDSTVAVVALIGEGQTASPAMLAGLSAACAIVAAHHPGASQVWPHRYWTATACPGEQLTAAIEAGTISAHPDELKLEPNPPKGPRMLATTINADGRAEEFRIDAAGKVVHRWQLTAGGKWSAYLPMGSPGQVDQLAAFTNADGRAEVIAMHSAYGAIFRTYQTAPGGPWSPWLRD
jgi:hypothetical protein